jgi:hypothetical protein
MCVCRTWHQKEIQPSNLIDLFIDLLIYVFIYLFIDLKKLALTITHFVNKY